MSASGRYAELSIATPMHRWQLCVDEERSSPMAEDLRGLYEYMANQTST